MIWLVWRRQRVALLVALTAVVLVVAGLTVARVSVVSAAAARGVSGCLEPMARCTDPLWSQFVAEWPAYVPLALLFPLVLPGAVGVIAGAALFSREMEQGTDVFVLTQSVGVIRWWASGLLVVGIPVGLVMAAVTPLLAWVRSPALAMTGSNPLRSPIFETSGLLLAGYAVLGFTLAAMAGLLLRNALGAIVGAVVVQLTLQMVLGFGVRNEYIAPVRETVPMSTTLDTPTAPADAVVTSSGYLDAGGQPVMPAAGRLTDACAADFGACLRDLGAVSGFVDYQPASRYWPFQGIESGILLVLVAGTLGAGVWGLRKRVG